MVTAVQRAWEVLDAVPDPEIPVVSIRELGILREINEHDGEIEVVITPTYSGCPAMGQIEDDVRSAMSAAGIDVRIVTRLAPPWTTDWIADAAKAKLIEYGIAPPHTTAQPEHVMRFAPPRDTGARIACPHCGSANTTETSHFGSTACKALYKCLDCLEPFDYFKPY
jgi:ring-1,2-phenylacetyl-CoA epoxidase subunit PaaD